jgi:hypothetical protein
MTTHRITNANDVRSGNALPANRAVLGVPTKNLVYEDLINASGSPVVAAHTNTAGVFATPFIAASQAVTGAGNLTINGSWAAAGVATVDWPRTIAVASSNGGDTTQTVTITGTDLYGATMTQALTLNGETTVATTKAFYTVTQIAVSAALTGNITVDVGNTFGLSYKARRGGFLTVQRYTMTAGVVANAVAPVLDYNIGVASIGTFTFYDNTSPATSATADVRGTYAPHTAPTGSGNTGYIYSMMYVAENGPNNSDGFGQTQA